MFVTLLDAARRSGVTPAKPRFVCGDYYEPGSLIWTSRWVTTDGIIESRDVLAFPGDERRLVLLRRIRALDREAALSMLLDHRSTSAAPACTALRRESWSWLAGTAQLTSGAAARQPRAATVLTRAPH